MRPYPKVSVYIINYNYAPYVEQAIESVLRQTFQDFEILVIDDGSTDGSRNIIEKYATHDKVMVTFQEHKGLNRTNNVALERSKGEYIVRLDADDYLDEHALEIMSNALDRRPNVGLVFPDYFLVDEEGQVLDMIRRHDFDDVTQFDQPAHGACTMIRRSNLLTLDGYDEAFHCQDGWDLWVRFIGRFGVTNVNLPLFFYRQHAASLTSDENKILSTRAQILRKNTPNGSNPLKGIAVIPVRGPSLDPRSPVLLPLGDKKVIDWTVEAALGAVHVDQVIITSPDEAVKEYITSQYEDRVQFKVRDWRLATIDKSLDDTLTNALGDLPDELRDFDVVIVMFCESPFRTAVQIDSAVDAMEIFGCNRVVSVRRQAGQFFKHTGHGMEPLTLEGKLVSHEREFLYRAAGDLFVVRRGHFYRDTEQDMNVGHIEVDEKSALRISSDWTYTLAKLYADHESQKSFYGVTGATSD